MLRRNVVFNSARRIGAVFYCTMHFLRVLSGFLPPDGTFLIPHGDGRQRRASRERIQSRITDIAVTYKNMQHNRGVWPLTLSRPR